ncbi:TetR/AcrR family transcriptional regulator C-terminal domain-containing protein [Dysosmobacter sp.]
MPIQTKALIAQQFAAMIRQRSVDKITVRDLVEVCHISRQTFYYHFQDIMDVVEWSVRQAMEQTLRQSLLADTPQAALRVFTSAVIEGRPLLEKLLHSHQREQIELLLVETMRTYLQELLRSRPPAAPVHYADLDVLLDFYAYGIVGLLLKYCGDPRMDGDRLAQQLELLLNHRLLSEEAPGLSS